ncbi:MAG: hypothetical protein AB8H03_03865 [Saprospiraceae bacterium]
MGRQKSELKLAYENMMRKKKIEIHLVNLEKRIRLQEMEINRLSRIMAKEEEDVHNLDKVSMQSLFQTILGNKQEALEKERQEYLMAVLQFQGAEKNLMALKFEKEILEKQLSGLFQAEMTFDNLFKKYEQTISSQLDNKTKAKIKAIDLRILNHEERIVEIREAIRAGKKAEKVLTKIIDDLSEVKTWGNSILAKKKIKIYGGGSAADAKKKFLYHAKNDAQKANILLEHFEIEILDIYTQFKLDYRQYIKSFTNFLEIFYDNLITDWIIKEDIKNTSYAIETIHDKVLRILAMLDNEIVKTKEYILEEKQIMKMVITNS